MKNEKKTKYVHTVDAHNLESPNEILPIILDIIKPKSVVDVGCGLGTFLKVCKNNGVKNVLGLDGSWVNKDLLLQNLQENEFIELDLEKKINLKQKFDLAICLEVVEHLHESAADTIVDSLTSLSDVILFSAAAYLQGGQNHLNEQRLDYWQEKFAKHDYVFYDYPRKIFWENPAIFWWYRQNMFIVAHKSYELNHQLAQSYCLPTIRYYLHPESYEKNTQMLFEIIAGQYKLNWYLRFISKWVLNKLKIKS